MVLKRVPRLPKATKSEVAIVGAAGLGVLAPIFYMMPGADEKLSNQTTKWANRWDNQTNKWAPRWEKNIQRVEPPVSSVVQKLDAKLPLERMAKGTHSAISKGIDRFSGGKAPPPPGV